MSKVPCGGFKLDENFLSMNENDELSLTGGSGEGKAYQYLVTDGYGNVQWEDGLAYEGSRVAVSIGGNKQLVKVADEVPTWASVDASTEVWMSDGHSLTVPPKDNIDFGNGSFVAKLLVFFITTDNFEFKGVVFPEKGVYFVRRDNGAYVSGIASAGSEIPEITWDGNIEFTKTIDPKYIPSELNEVILPSSTPSSSKKFKITVDDSGNITATQV